MTLRTVFWSILVASPLPVAVDDARLWSAVRTAVPAGGGDWRWVTATVPLLWVVMICATFAGQTGCLSPTLRLAAAPRGEGDARYLMNIGLIVPLIMALIIIR